MGHIKGSQIVGIVKVLRSNREAFEKLLPKSLHFYMNERILVSGWYPDEEHIQLLMALGQYVKPFIKGDVWRYIGEAGAKTDLAGAYSPLLRPGDPAATLLRFAHVWEIYHRDSGTLQVKLESPNRGRIEVKNYDVICRDLAEVMAGYDLGILRMAGARDVEVEVLECKDHSSAVWLASWRPSET